MRMDENSNPEWMKMLEGTSSGRKALEKIHHLKAENQRLARELKGSNKGAERNAHINQMLVEKNHRLRETIEVLKLALDHANSNRAVF